MSSAVPWIKPRRGFTLVETLAVTVIICILVSVMIGVAKYANLRMATARANAQMASLQTAIEMYKADVGYYPASSIVRYSGSGNAEITNSWLLYRALTQTKRYYRANLSDTGSLNGLTYFKDPWGTPWNYYRPVPSQSASLVVSNICGTWPAGPFNASYAVGGQRNPTTYDLYSYGPDTITTIPGAQDPSTCSYGWRGYGGWSKPGHDTDDIVNWKP